MEPKTEVVQKSQQSCGSISNSFARHNGNNTTPPLRKPVQISVSNPERQVESDEAYAEKKIALGIYNNQLKEVATYSCLKKVFLMNLQNSDSRLHSVMIRSLCHFLDSLY